MAKILIVEDDILMLNMLSALLKNAGFEITSVMNGEEALEILKTNSFDIMVADLIMPKKNGKILISEAKTQYPKMEIISITENNKLTSNKYHDLSEKIGAFISFEKPIDKAAFLMAVQLLVHDNKTNLTFDKIS